MINIQNCNMKGLSGLFNTGNTCYMNSAIQAFSHNYLFTDYIFKNEEDIKIKLLQNAPRNLKDNEQFFLNKDTMINHKLKEKIKSPDYDYTSLTDEEKDIIYNQTITYQLLKLLKKMWSINSRYTPTSFKEIFSNHRNSFFSGNKQHDAEEAYSCILQTMHSELAQKKNIKIKIKNYDTAKYITLKKYIFNMYNNAVTTEEKTELLRKYNQIKLDMKDNIVDYTGLVKVCNELGNSYSELSKIFTGFLRSSINCCKPDCLHSSNNFEPFNHLSLPIPNKHTVNLLDCFDEYCKDEILDDNNRWLCDMCNNKGNAIKKLQLWTIPPILVVQLNRFNQTLLRKNNKFVKYPKDGLNIKKYVSHIQYYNDQCYEYRLQSIIAHTGDVNGGHYYTITLDDDTGKWLLFNDESVHIINDNVDIIIGEAYILFYMNKSQLITPETNNVQDYI